MPHLEPQVPLGGSLAGQQGLLVPQKDTGVADRKGGAGQAGGWTDP